MTLTDLDAARLALAINLELDDGRHGASARVEVREHAGRRVAKLDLRGWIADAAVRRLEATLRELRAHDVDGLLLDGTRLRHIEYWGLRRLGRALAPFESLPDGVEWHGLSPGMRARFEASLVAADPSPAAAPGGACAS
jgi:hypothetical protein